MGNLVFIECQCGFNEKLREGIGMRASVYPKIIYDAIKKGEYEKYGINPDDIEEQNQVLGENNKDNFPEYFDIKYRIFYCKNCNTYDNLQLFKIKMKNGQIKKPKTVCTKCKKRMKRINISDLNHKKCPECGSELSFENRSLTQGWWD